MENTIKTFEDACATLGISAELPQVIGLPEKHAKGVLAHYKLMVIAQALNAGWEPNWNDWDEYKYYPWFEMGKDGASPGVGFSFCDDVCVSAGSAVGSRLCYKSEELAVYAGKQFEDLYKEYLLIS